MGLLSKLKSLLGLGEDRPARRGNVDVTVEHEPGETPDAESERAVKEPATEPEPTTGGEAGSVGEATDADPIEEAEPTAEEPAGGTAAEPAEEPAGAESGADEAGADAVEEEAESEPVEEEEPADAEPEAPETGPATESVETIKGVGPSYAEKLENAGVETVGDLAVADADALGDETDLSPKRISRWIEQAEARTQ